MRIYEQMQKIASGILRDFQQGKTELVRIVPGTGPAYNPGKPTETRFTVQGAVVRGVLEKYVRNGLASASDMQATIEAGAIDPALADFFEVDGIRYKITQRIPKPAAGTVVAWVLILQR